VDENAPTRVKRTSAPAIGTLLGFRKPNRIDKDYVALLSTLLKFIVLPYASIWQSLFQVGTAVFNSAVGYPNPPHAITNPFTINHGPFGSRPTFGSYPTYNYHDPYVGAITYGLQLLQAL
jgi:hypothetical protein